MGFLSWTFLIVLIIGIVYYVNEVYGPIKKENFNNDDETDFKKDDKKDSKKDNKKDNKKDSKKKSKNNALEDEDDEEEEDDPPPKPKKKKKNSKICFGDKCIPKAALQMELDAVDDETREELMHMLYKK